MRILAIHNHILGIVQENISHIDKEKQKPVARIKRVRGQVDSIEPSLTTGDRAAIPKAVKKTRDLDMVFASCACYR
jgi:hypothetical protein